MNNKIESLLVHGLNPHWRRVKADVLTRLEKGFHHWRLNTDKLEGIAEQDWQPIQLAQFLLWQINHWLEEIDEQQQQYSAFGQKYLKAINHAEARQYLVEMAIILDYAPKAVAKIRHNKAPWVDENALTDGHIKKLAAKEQDIANTLERLADVLQQLLSNAAPDMVGSIWQLLSLQLHLQPALQYQGYIHIRIAAFACLSKALTTLAGVKTALDHQIPANIVQYIYRTCLDEELDIWLRSEALTLVSQLDPEQLFSLIDNLFVGKMAKDMYLRGKVAQLLCQYKPEQQQYTRLHQAVAMVAADHSDYVRQTLVKYAIGLDPNERFNLLADRLINDDCKQVRAQIYLTLAESLKVDLELLEQVAAIQQHALETETDPFALRALLETLPGCATVAQSPQYLKQTQQQLELVSLSTTAVATKAYIARTREYLWAVDQSILPQSLCQQLKTLPLQRSLSFKLEQGTGEAHEQQQLQRYLATIGRERYGFDIKRKGKKWTVRAGFKFGFRFWRFWHELRNSATDKRQDHNHLKGRLYYGLTQTSSLRMAEMSATKVPGEPLFIGAEQGWRDHLPLLDQVLSSLDQGWPTQAVKIYSAHGITSIMPPKGLFARLYARTIIQFRFAQLAQLRNETQSVQAYIQQLQKLGFEISIKGYLDDQGQHALVDSQVQRFFNPKTASAALPFSLPGLTDIQNYFYSVYHNTIGQLIAFTAVVTGGYLATHITKLVKMRRARNNIPLVIGGWGTRGKSGTERLKAALFNAMGLRVVSKTTGCEAMFLFGPANRPMKEMFLFRPYDKASIWEQVFLTEMSAKLGADVFLWECMGLTPRYIDIIQNQWMRDDIATITNCYPDHEDLQGPAGYEIPTVMQRFVPHNSVLIASEESMLPLLEDAAMAKNTELLPVSWLESGLLTDDVVARFPYEEHPNNIALVAQMAKVLDIPEDFAFKAMADNVVADLGVLKIYPVAHVRQRRLAFINGMSANERLGAMGNWQRTGLAAQSLDEEPGKWLGIVINNRDDRIARSKVFASMLVNDTQADCYFFIGNNLGGFGSYIVEAWQQFQANCTIESVERFTELSQKFRIATSQTVVLARLRACIEGVSDSDLEPDSCMPEHIDTQVIEQWHLPQLSDNPDQQAIYQAIEGQFKRDANEYLEFKAYSEQFGQHQPTELLEWIWSCFKSRWVVVEDYYSTGNQTIDIMVRNTPPGLLSRIIGMQNIKGTGLDFIYRWQAWDQVYQHCETLVNGRDEKAIEAAIKALTTWEEFGLLDEEKVRQSLAQAKDRPETQTELIQTQLQLTRQRLELQLSKLTTGGQPSQQRSKVWDWLVNGLEAFLDAGDAIKRRKRADDIYQAILDNLISYDKASVELAKLTKAQKGGWLAARLQRLLDKDR